MDNEKRESTKSSKYPDGFRIMMGTQEYVSYRDHSSIRIWYYDKGYACPGHHHSAVEIVMCLEGKMELMLENTTYDVKTGQVLIIPSDCGHAMKNGDGTTRILFLFEPDVIRSMRDVPLITEQLKKPILFEKNTPEGEEAFQLLLTLSDCYKQAGPMWNMQCYAYLLQFYALLGRTILHTEEKNNHTATFNTDAELMNSVMTYIIEHAAEPISLEDAANFAGFSRFYFSRMFNDYAGMSFTEFLNRHRLAMADHLLISTRDAVSDIAQQVGFGSMATFSRVFQKVHKCTPSKFRAIYTDE